MKKLITFVLLSLFVSVAAMAQLTPINWVKWDPEADGGEPAYATTDYDKQVMNAPKVSDITIDASLDFDALWESIDVEAQEIKNHVDGPEAPAFDVSAGFGAEWKAAWDGTYLYVLLKFYDDAAQATERGFEIGVQPNFPDRYEPDFEAAGDDVVAQNKSYCRYNELGGSKTKFVEGVFNESVGTFGADGSWGANTNSSVQIPQNPHFFNKTDGGVIQEVIVIDFAESMAYQTDPYDAETKTAYIPEDEDKIALFVQAFAALDEENTVKACWSSTENNGYTSLYYNGYLVLSGGGSGTADPLTPINWVKWDPEADGGEPVYATTAYDKKTMVAKKAPADWSFDANSLDFDALWSDINTEAQEIKNHVDGPETPAFDVSAGFGAEWKAMWDDDNVYVLLQFYDDASQATERGFEIGVQPKYPDRYEPDFEAAGDDVVAQNKSYCRYNELGGSKTKFVEGVFNESVGTFGADGSWGANTNSSVQIPQNPHFFNKTDGGVIQEVIVLDFAESMAYLSDPYDEGTKTAYSPSADDKLAWFVQAFAALDEENTVKACWSSTANNGYTSLYYNGYLQLSGDPISASIADARYSHIKVYTTYNQLRIKGVERTGVEIYNVAGMLVKSAKDVTNSLNISDLKRGIYLVKIDEVPQAFKVVKR